MALDLAADLQRSPSTTAPSSSDQLLACIASLPEDTAQNPLQGADSMAGGVDLLWARWSRTQRVKVKAGAIGQLDPSIAGT